MYVNIDKCVKVGDVGYCVFEDYIWLQVVYCFDVIGKLSGFKFWMWIVIWFFQFFDDVGYCWYIEFFISKVRCFQVMQFVVVIYQIFQCLLCCCQNVFYYWIGFWVNGRCVQWVIIVVNV